MIVFEIKDASWICEDGTHKVLGYLFYYPQSRRFYAEILSDLDEWEAPAIFYSNIKKGVYSIDSIWTMKWVRQRIIPLERQNIGSILKDNNLKEYDEYRLLVLSAGKCAQDDNYITKVDPTDLPDEIAIRLSKKVQDVMVLSGRMIEVFFKNKESGLIDLNSLHLDKSFDRIMKDDDIFNSVTVSPGGNGIEWDELRYIPAEKLYKKKTDIPIKYSDLLNFADKRLADTSAVSNMLGVSRQYINQMVDKGSLTPVTAGTNTQIFAKAQIETL